MGHPMMQREGNGGGHDWPRVPFIPIPMAMFGMMVSFMFGITLGHLLARKHASSRSEWEGPMAWKHRMGMGHGMGMGPGMGHGMGMGMGMGHGGGKWMKHHHHGSGPACRCDDWPQDEAEEPTSQS